MKSLHQPFDILMGSTQLLFREVKIPADLIGVVDQIGEELDLSAISRDGKNCCQYIVWVAMVAQVLS